MTNYVDSTGLRLETLTEIFDGLVASFQAIYGADINVEANSPDGQMIGIFAQAKIDMLDCISQVYNSFSPSSATGNVLAQRCLINGVVKNGATYTRTNVVVTTDGAVELLGLDTDESNPFTVSDEAGNNYFLEGTVTTANGTNTLAFRAENAGAVETTINTITTIVTVTLGVISCNNPNSAIYTGLDEESDPALRARREAAVSAPSQGYLTGMAGAIANLEEVLDVRVYENFTDTEDGYTIPPRSIWAIVDCPDTTEAKEAVAEIIYQKRSLGCGMKGSESVTITEVNGNTMDILFDLPVYEDLYITLFLQSIDPAYVLDEEYIAAEIYARLTYGIYEPADVSTIIALIKEIDENAVIRLDLGGGINDDGGETYDSFLYPSTVQSRWLLDVAKIDLTIET
jgi:uncharacterized phage protein gp47/JayE